MNNALHQFIKSKGGEVVNKKGWLDYKDYRFRYVEGGFEMKDMQNYSKPVDIAEVFDDIPTPRQVYDYINKPKVKINPIADIEREMDEEVSKKLKKFHAATAKGADKLLGKGKTKQAIKDLQKVFAPEPVVEKEKPQELSLEELRKKAVAIIQRNTDPKKILAKVKGMIPNRSYNNMLGRIGTKYKNGKIRAPKFKTMVLDLTKTTKFEEGKKPAPKFTGLPFWDIDKLDIGTTTVTYWFAGKPMTCSKSKFMLHYLLSDEPKVNVAIMQFVRKTINLQQFLHNPYIRDRFTAFEMKEVTAWDADLFHAIVELYYQWGVDQPLNWVYKNETTLKKGDRIVVEWADLSEKHNATVIDTRCGIELRYEDGDVIKLLKHQRWQLQNINQQAEVRMWYLLN